MANQLDTVRSLQTLSSGYSVFERDQVLTEAQLNSVSRFFDDQERMTRVQLCGVGIVGGLRPFDAAGVLKVEAGVAVTTDGDLLALLQDTRFDGVLPFDDAAPRYAPFYRGDGTMLQLWELVPEGATPPGKQPLANVGALSGFAAVLYMESYELDHDLCDVANCNNQGVEAVNHQKLLLVALADAGALAQRPQPVSQLAQGLAWLSTVRPKLNATIETVSQFAASHRAGCSGCHGQLIQHLPTLAAQLPRFVERAFGSDPTASWLARLNDLNQTFAARDSGIQYYYAFLKDLIETWNDLRDALLADETVLCPDLSLFPKHVLLGEMGGASAQRTPFFPTPLGVETEPLQLALFLARRLQTLIFSADFKEPAPVVSGTVTVTESGRNETRSLLASVRVTPSKSEASPLAERAIPVYYGNSSQFLVLDAWSRRAGRTRRPERLAGYRWDEYVGQPAPDFLARSLSAHDFFRVEGCLGRPVQDVMTTLERMIEQQNLPFKVASVLVHNDRKKVVVRPPRYTGLHLIHYLLRKEVQAQLKFGRDDNSRFRAAAITVPGADTVAIERQSQQVEQGIDAAVGTLSLRSFSSYRLAQKDPARSWNAPFQSAATNLGTLRQSLSEVVRSDYPSASEALINAGQYLSLERLDLALGARDDRADDKLLLKGFFADHPGLEPLGGVLRGGTFVLVYDDRGAVVGDLALPYRVADPGEPEPEEQELPDPDHPAGSAVPPKYKLIERLNERFPRELAAFQAKLQPLWQKDINIQQDYTKFFTESLSSLTDVLVKASGKDFAVAVPPRTTDAVLDADIADIQATAGRLDALRRQIAAGGLTPEATNQLKLKITETEQSLGKKVTDTTRYMAEAKIEAPAGSAAGEAVRVIGESLLRVKDEETVRSVARDLNVVGNANASAGGLVGRVLESGGVGRLR